MEFRLRHLGFMEFSLQNNNRKQNFVDCLIIDVL